MNISTRYIIIEKVWKSTRQVVTYSCIQFSSYRLALAGTSIRIVSSRVAIKPYNIINTTRYCRIDSKFGEARFIICSTNSFLSTTSIDTIFSVRKFSDRAIHSIIISSSSTRLCSICRSIANTRFIYAIPIRSLSINTINLSTSLVWNSFRYGIVTYFPLSNRYCIYSTTVSSTRSISSIVARLYHINSVSSIYNIRYNYQLICFVERIDTNLIRYCVFNSFSNTLRYSVRKAYVYYCTSRSVQKFCTFNVNRYIQVNTIDFRYGTTYLSTRNSVFKSIIYNSVRKCEYVPEVNTVPNYLLPVTTRNLINKPIQLSYFTYLKPLKIVLLYDNNTLIFKQESNFIRLFSGSIITLQIPHDRTRNYKKKYYVQLFDIFGHNEQQLVYTRLFSCQVILKKRYTIQRIITLSSHVTRNCIYSSYSLVSSNRSIVQVPLVRIRSTRNCTTSSRHLTDRAIILSTLISNDRYIRTKLLITNNVNIIACYLVENTRFITQSYTFVVDKDIVFNIGSEYTIDIVYTTGDIDTRVCTFLITLIDDRNISLNVGDIDTRVCVFSFTKEDEKYIYTESIPDLCSLTLTICEFGIDLCPECFIFDESDS